MYYKFDSELFANDVIACLERVGFDHFILEAKTTEKVVLRAIKWRNGTISAQTVAKFCNVMRRSPLVYFKPVVEKRKK